MAIIAQKEIFGWEEIEAKSDLQRLRLVLETLPDEGLMRELESERKGRRDEAHAPQVRHGAVYHACHGARTRQAKTPRQTPKPNCCSSLNTQIPPKSHPATGQPCPKPAHFTTRVSLHATSPPLTHQNTHPTAPSHIISTPPMSQNTLFRKSPI